MPFSKLRNSLSNLATPFLANAINNFASKQGAKDAGKVAAQLRKKGPFDIDDAPSAKLIENPLSFSPVQYPLDLGNNGLGHYILFESGFVGYSPQTSPAFSSKKRQQRVTSKVGDKSITTAAIALYMPSSIKSSYQQTYEGDTAGIAGDLEAIKGGIDKIAKDAGGPPGTSMSSQQIKAALEGATGIAIRQGKKLVGELVSMAGAGDPVRFLQKRSGTALNPRNEQFYDSPDFRSFSYTFDFWPRNMKEAKAVNDIIMIFKYNSAPGLKGKAGAIFELPNYFRISYMHRGEENTNLNKISACYCQGVDVDYAPDGEPRFFEDGQPVHTRLSVNFIEDRIITKDDIVQGA
tara:strand:- start:917 stop:1963 length:1047 start_codon:yes stop_codon:yes gene_type:complete